MTSIKMVKAKGQSTDAILANATQQVNELMLSWYNSGLSMPVDGVRLSLTSFAETEACFELVITGTEKDTNPTTRRLPVISIGPGHLSDRQVGQMLPYGVKMRKTANVSTQNPSCQNHLKIAVGFRSQQMS